MMICKIFENNTKDSGKKILSQSFFIARFTWGGTLASPGAKKYKVGL